MVLVARRASELDRLAGSLGESLGAANAVPFAADLAAPDTAEGAVAAALDTWDRLDGALISVGGPPAGSVANTSEDQWRGAFESVFLAGLRVQDAVLARATASDPAIGWVLSTSVKSPVGGLAASNGFRPGLGMLIKQSADEFGPRGVRVFGLMPGRIETERVQHLDSLADDPVAARAAAEAAIPLGRYGRPDEFGRVAAFLLSPVASYVTGCMIPIEGGALRSL